MDFQQKFFSTVIVLQMSGRIDQSNHQDFDKALQDCIAQAKTDGRAVVMDFEQIEYISSIGLRAIMKGSQICRPAKISFMVANLNSVVKKIFEVSKFNYVVQMHDTMEAALKTLSPEAWADYQG